MNNFSVTSKVVNGKLTRNRNRIQDIIQSFEGKDIEMTIKKKRRTRSTYQNRYYWGVLIPITIDAIKTEWGEIWCSEKAHEFYKQQFLFTERINEETGEILRIPKSTSDNTPSEQEDYHTQIREFLKEWFNIDTPLPNEELTINF